MELVKIAANRKVNKSVRDAVAKLEAGTAFTTRDIVHAIRHDGIVASDGAIGAALRAMADDRLIVRGDIRGHYSTPIAPSAAPSTPLLEEEPAPVPLAADTASRLLLAQAKAIQALTEAVRAMTEECRHQHQALSAQIEAFKKAVGE